MIRTLSDDQLAVIADTQCADDGMSYCEECGHRTPEDAPCEVCDPAAWEAYLDEIEAEHRAFLGDEFFYR